jgi:FAD/FMN-containing dehydrogenase
MIRSKECQELADILGEDFFSADLYMRDLYSSDITALPGILNDLFQTEVDAIAQPTSTEVVSNIMKYCSSKKIPVIPRGHGTSGYGGTLPTKNGLILEMTRMNEVYSLDKEKMTIEVGAGIIWKHLLEFLEDEGLTVPAYPSSASSSSVGGWINAGGSGIGSTKYGEIHDQVVDLEVVLPDGVVIRTAIAGKYLSKYRQKPTYAYYPGSETYFWGPDAHGELNNDVTKLFIDSNGCMGVITKAVLKVIPLRNIKPMVASFKSRQLMIQALEDLLGATRPFYLHFINGDFYQMLFELGKAPETSGEWVVLSCFEGTEDEVAVEMEKFQHFVRRNNGVTESDEIARHEWDERFYPMRIRHLGPSLAPSEVYVPLKNLEGFLSSVDTHFKDERHAIEGVLTNTGEVAALAWFPDDERKKISFLMGWCRSLDFIDDGVRHGGRPYSIGLWNISYSRSFYGKEKLSQIYEIKHKVDPKNILNPNKVFSGSLYLSLRLNLLIMISVGIAFPIILGVAGLLVPTLIAAYFPWIVPRTAQDFILAFCIGLILGEMAVEIANIIPIGFVLSIERPFMRIFRKISR